MGSNHRTYLDCCPIGKIITHTRHIPLSMKRNVPISVRTIFEVVGITLLALIVSVVVGMMFLIPMLMMGFDIETTSVYM